MADLLRHADHDPAVICRPAFGHGLCEPLGPWPAPAATTTIATARSIMTTKPLTADDITEYQVQVAHGGNTSLHQVHAAYVTTEDGWLLFKDHEHRTVAQFNANLVLVAQRSDNIGIAAGDHG